MKKNKECLTCEGTGLVDKHSPQGPFGCPKCKGTGTLTGLDKKSEVINFLAEERIKLNCDYAIASKYGEIHIICNKMWADRIREVAGQFGLPITSLHTWDTRTKGNDYCGDCGHVYYNCLCAHEDL